MTTTALIASIIVTGAATAYFAVRSRDFRKFLAGAFFVSSGVQFYFYLAGVSIPLLGTDFVQTPESQRRPRQRPLCSLCDHVLLLLPPPAWRTRRISRLSLPGPRRSSLCFPRSGFGYSLRSPEGDPLPPAGNSVRFVIT
jgi:hypothetical protein